MPVRLLIRPVSVALGSLLFAAAAQGQVSAPNSPNPQKSNTPPAVAAPQSSRDLSQAYYHAALAGMYEELVASYGEPDYAAQAIEEYKLALNYDPDSVALNNGLAALYLKVGRVRDAVTSAQSLIKQNPNNLEAHKLLGRVYLRSLGDAQEGQQSDEVLKLAIAEYETISRLEPKSVEDHLLLGQLYTLAKQPEKGKQEFETARNLDPGSEDAVLNLARLYGEQGDTAGAIKVLASVPEGQRTAKEAEGLAASYDEVKDTKNAIAAYRKALEIDPDNMDLKRALARDYTLDGDDAEALKVYQGMATADPNNAATLVRLADLQRRAGDYSGSLVTLEKAEPLAKNDPDVSNELQYNLALVQDTLGHYQESAAILERLVADSYHGDEKYTDSEKNNRSIFLDRLANVYREEGKTADAIATYQKIVDLGGEYVARGYQFMVDTYRDAHDFGKALEVARQAVTADPDNRDLKLMLATQLCDNDKVDECLKLANAQLTNTPGDRDVYLQLAQMYQRLKRYNDASAALDGAEKFAKTPDQRLYIYFERGALAERQKHYQEAEAQFAKVLAIDPNNAATLNYLGFMQADRGVNLEEDLKLVKHAVQLDPQNGAYLDSLGWVYFKLGQYELAEQNLRSAIDREPTDPSLRDHLGQLYEKTGRLKLASEQWEKALKLYASSNAADIEPGERERVEKHLESARVKLARENNTLSK